MTIQLVVLDFDGTLTNADLAARPFAEELERGVSDLVGENLSPRWAALDEQIRRHPDAHAWQLGPDAVAPADCEPYVRATAIAIELLHGRPQLADIARRHDVLTALHKRAYLHATKIHATRRFEGLFRQGAQALFPRLSELGVPVAVVTNAVAAPVGALLDALTPGLSKQVRLVGDARKFERKEALRPHPAFERLPMYQPASHGAPRDLLLRRGYYLEALQTLWDATGIRPEETLVCGDVYELDLALPAALGAHVHLVTGPNTRPWEKALVEALGAKGSWSDALEDIALRAAGKLPAKPPTAPPAEIPPEGTNVAIVRRAFEAFIRKDVDGVLRLLTDDVRFVIPGPPGILPWAGTFHGHAGVRRFLETNFATCDHLSYEVKSYVDAGDTVLALQREEGYVRKTGRYFQNELAGVVKLRDGRVCEYVEYSDTAALVSAFF